MCNTIKVLFKVKQERNTYQQTRQTNPLHYLKDYIRISTKDKQLIKASVYTTQPIIYSISFYIIITNSSTYNSKVKAKTKAATIASKTRIKIKIVATIRQTTTYYKTKISNSKRYKTKVTKQAKTRQN